MRISKIVSCLLIMALVVGSLTSYSPKKALADEKEINIAKNNNGQYVNAKDEKNSLKGHLVQGDVYSLDDGTLLLKTSTDVYEKVKRHTAKLSDKDQINAIMNDASIAQEIKDEVLKTSKQAIAINNKQATVDIYTPDTSNEITNNISSMSTIDAYYTYQGKNMKDTVLYYTYMQSGPCYYVNGIDYSSVLSSTISIVVTGASEANVYIALFSTGVSLLQDFLSSTGAKLYHGSTSDYSFFNAQYDRYLKWTFVDLYGDGSWATGATTEWVYLRSVYYEEYLFTDIGGKTTKKTITYNKNLFSPNYQNPAPKAYQYAGSTGWAEAYMTMKVGNTTLVY